MSRSASSMAFLMSFRLGREGWCGSEVGGVTGVRRGDMSGGSSVLEDGVVGSGGNSGSSIVIESLTTQQNFMRNFQWS